MPTNKYQCKSNVKLTSFFALIVNLHFSFAYTKDNFIVEGDKNSPVVNQSQNTICSKTAIGDDLKPNIVLIMADDLGWGDFGSYWPHTALTPNVDAITKEGMRLTDFHASASVCAPSRSALLTGRLGLRTGVVQNFAKDAVGGIPENETTLAEILRDAGYRTAMIGKWHLGTSPGHHPIDKGFQAYLGIPYSIDMGCTDPPGANLPACPPCPHENMVFNKENDCHISCDEELALPLYVNKTIIQQPAQLRHLSEIYAEFAEEFMSERKEPFFMYVALSHIHVPLAHGPTFENITGKGIFADTLFEMDWLIGKIVRTAMRYSKNNLIWILSDNGPWEVKCDLAGSSGPFVGAWQRDVLHGGGGGSAAKQTVWEGGHRVPSLVLWPGYIEPGSMSNALVSALDVFPTIAAVCNISLPTDRYFDGIDVQGILTGELEKAHEVLFHPNSGAAGPEGEIGAVRIQEYKVVYYSGGSPECGGRTGPSVSHISSPLVFNLKNDPGETYPLKVTSSEWKATVHAAGQALAWLHENVQQDNTSTVDYTKEHSARPCCDKYSPICRCPWD
ncbi:arylsulfatase G-like isoform X2 [Schistocerca piceifrons]|nr:arylsulfatase G-like isoform X2 [Schistocerca piceifrons]XP_047107538.1 arylsulfatase G-like isoform X2 [Schistocerca piceifrons]